MPEPPNHDERSDPPNPLRTFLSELWPQLDQFAAEALRLRIAIQKINWLPEAFPRDDALQLLHAAVLLPESSTANPAEILDAILELFGLIDGSFPHRHEAAEEGATVEEVRVLINSFTVQANAILRRLPGTPPPPALDTPVVDETADQASKASIQRAARDVVESADAALQDAPNDGSGGKSGNEYNFLKLTVNGAKVTAIVTGVAVGVVGVTSATLERLGQAANAFPDHARKTAKVLGIALTYSGKALGVIGEAVQKLGGLTQEFVDTIGPVLASQREEELSREEESEEDFQSYLDQLEAMLESASLSLEKVFEKPRKEIRQADLHTITSLRLSFSGIGDIQPLSRLTALQSLDLKGTKVSDVAPLSGLTTLQSLYLGSTKVSDIAPLSGLTALQLLRLDGTNVSDVAPLSGLTAFQSLTLGRTKVSDLAPLSGLTALQSLDLKGT